MHILLLPYIEQDNLVGTGFVDNIANPQYTNCATPNSLGAQVVNAYICPAESLLPPYTGVYSGATFALTTYGGCSGTSATNPGGNTSGTMNLQNGVFFINSSVRLTDIRDGTSQTLMFGERSRLNLPATSTSEVLGGWAWVNAYALEDNCMNTSSPIEGGQGCNPTTYLCPDGVTRDLNQFGSQHSGGNTTNFCFADGSIHTLQKSISIVVYQQLSAIKDGNVVDPTQYD